MLCLIQWVLWHFPLTKFYSIIRPIKLTIFLVVVVVPGGYELRVCGQNKNKRLNIDSISANMARENFKITNHVKFWNPLLESSTVCTRENLNLDTWHIFLYFSLSSRNGMRLVKTGESGWRCHFEPLCFLIRRMALFMAGNSESVNQIYKWFEIDKHRTHAVEIRGSIYARVMCCAISSRFQFDILIFCIFILISIFYRDNGMIIH